MGSVLVAERDVSVLSELFAMVGKPRQNRKHYIAMSGDHGCLPDHCQVYSTKRVAIADLANLFGDMRGVQSDLRKYNYCELSDKQSWEGERGCAGAEYAEVEICTCADPGQHDEEGKSPFDD